MVLPEGWLLSRLGKILGLRRLMVTRSLNSSRKAGSSATMSSHPILASDMTPLLNSFVAINWYLGLVGIVSVVLNLKWGRRRWWGFLCALPSILVGCFSLLLVVVSSHGALPAVYVLASFPLVSGLCSLAFWSRRGRESVCPNKTS